MPNEKTPTRALPVNYVPPGGLAYRIVDGDNWWNVARRFSIDVNALMRFNFQTIVPEEVNWYLRRNVGCKLATPDGRNWRFSTTASPGLIYIPLMAVTTPSTTRTTVFHPGVSHGHAPSGRWADVQANPNSSKELNLLCPHTSPTVLVGQAIGMPIFGKFHDKPIALEHLNWYLTNGMGRDFPENDNIEKMLKRDRGVQAAIWQRTPTDRTSGRYSRRFKLEQNDYADQDFRYAFGAIDILEFEVDFDSDTIHVWFQDRYEFHPVYPGLYVKFADDEVRPTNCLHAALVELKSSSARDFWMKGEATVPWSVIVNGAGVPRRDDGAH